jgi:hypothetical protein
MVVSLGVRAWRGEDGTVGARNAAWRAAPPAEAASRGARGCRRRLRSGTFSQERSWYGAARRRRGGNAWSRARVTLRRRVLDPVYRACSCLTACKSKILIPTPKIVDRKLVVE